MRTYEILDIGGNVVSEQTMEDTMAPSVLSGQSVRIKAVDGQTLAVTHRATVGTPEHGVIIPMPYHFVTEQQLEQAKQRVEARSAAQPVKE